MHRSGLPVGPSRGDLWIRGGTVVTAAGRARMDVLVLGGRIAALFDPQAAGTAVRGTGTAARGTGTAARGTGAVPAGATEAGAAAPARSEIPVVDASGRYVLPGVIDVHVHFREPGLEHKEDFLSGSRAAALGGVTTVLDMPNTVPPVSTAARLQEKAERLQGRSYVDFGLYGVIVPSNLNELTAMLEAGAVALKLFAGPTTGELEAPGWAQMLEVCRRMAGLGVTIAVHAEDRQVVRYWEGRIEASGGRTYEDLLASRPAYAEASSVAQATLLGAQTGCPIHICHVSSRQGVEVIAWAKAQGVPVTAETCPHYLLLTGDDYPRLGNRMKVLPYVRGRADQERLWRGLLDGTLDLVASDHAPHLPDEKARDLWSAPAGMPGVQTLLPLLLQQVNEGRLTLEQLVRVTSLRPAQVFGLYPRKGAIQVGSDADLVIVDPQAPWRMDEEMLGSRASLSPWEGATGAGRPVTTILRGRVIAHEGEAVGPPEGRWLRRGGPGPPSPQRS